MRVYLARSFVSTKRDTTRHLQKFQKEQRPGTQIYGYGYYFFGFACAFRIKFSENEENMTYA